MGRQEREEVEGYENGAARRSKRGKGGGGAVVGIAGIVLLGLAGKLVSRYVNLRKQESVCEKAGVKVVEDGVDQLLPAAALPELNGEEEDAAHTLPLPNLNGDACATVNGSKEWENGQQVEEEVVPAQGGLDGGEVEKEVEEEADVEEMRVELPQPEACRSSLVEVECTGSGSDEENPPSPSLMDSVDKPEVHHTSPIRMPVKDVTPAALQALQPVSPRKPPRSPSPSPSPSRLNSGKFADRLAAASIIADPDLILSHLLHPKTAPPPPPPLLPETEESYPPSLPKDLEGLPLSAQLKSVTWQHGTSVEEKHVAATAKQVVTSTHILEDKGVTEPIEEETFLDAGEVGMMKEAEASTDLKPPHHVHSADTCEDIWSSLGQGSLCLKPCNQAAARRIWAQDMLSRFSQSAWSKGGWRWTSVRGAAASKFASGYTPLTPKTLDSILDLNRLKQATAEEIVAIWNDYHIGRGHISAAMPKDVYTLFHRRATECPLFVIPLRKGDGYVSMLSQAQVPHMLFTSLEDYRKRGSEASPYFTVTHHQELAETKGLVLVRGDIVFTSQLSDAEAKKLLDTAHSFYLSDSRYRHVLKFNKHSTEFDFKKVLRELGFATA